jgi:hypothetical protein
MPDDMRRTGGRGCTPIGLSHEVCDEPKGDGATACKLKARLSAIAHEAAAVQARLTGTKA